MADKIRRIAVLTSGGDAPGMNAAIRAVVRASAAYGIECVGVRRGYQGLITGDLVPLRGVDVSGITNRGGTMLYTARSTDFLTDAGKQRAMDTMKYNGIDGLIAIGGDGTFRGCLELKKLGARIAGIPATIDNDIAYTEYTIGFDTACNVAIECVDKIRDTMASHERCSVVEVMGRTCGHIALYVGIAAGATAILVPEKEVDFEHDIIEHIRDGRLHGRTNYNIIVAEGAASAQEVANRIEAETGMEARVTVLGHVQRGGSPLLRDRVIASEMGVRAVRLLAEGIYGHVICFDGKKYTDVELDESILDKRPLDEEAWAMLDMLKPR